VVFSSIRGYGDELAMETTAGLCPGRLGSAEPSRPSLRDARERSRAAPALKRRATFTATTTWPQEDFRRPPFCSTTLGMVQTRVGRLS